MGLFEKSTIELDPYTEEELNDAIKECLQKSNNKYLSKKDKKKYLRFSQWLAELRGRKYCYVIPEKIYAHSANKLINHCEYIRNVEGNCEHCYFCIDNECSINNPYKWNVDIEDITINLDED